MKSNSIYAFFKKPIVAGFFTFIIMLLIMQFIAYQEYLLVESERKKELTSHVELIKEKLNALVMYSYATTKTLGYLVEREGIPEDFDQLASELLERSEYFDVVQLVDSQGYITHVYPLEGNDVIGFNIITSETSSSGALATIERNDFFIAGPVNLKQGGVGIISRQPIIINDKFSGFAAVITEITTFFEDLDINTSSEDDYLYQLSRVNQKTGEEVFFLDTDMSLFEPFSIPIETPFGEWKLYVVALNKGLNPAIWYALFGLLLAITGSWLTWYFTGQSIRINQYVQHKLLEQEKKLKTIHESTRIKIEKSESDLNKAQQIAKTGSWELDIKSNKLFWSKEMFRIFEIDFKGFEVDQGVFDKAIHPDDRDMVLTAFDESVKNKKSYHLSYRLKFENQRIKYVEDQCEIFYDDEQNPIKSFGTTQDITERIEKEKELLNYKNNLEELVSSRTEELNDSKEALLNLLEDLSLKTAELEKEKVKAQSADLMKSAFLATMSHELRTPMNSIIGFTSILLKEYAGPLNEEQKKQMTMVRNSGTHLLKLINDILDISKIEAGELVIFQEKFNFIDSINETIQFLEPQSQKKGIIFSTNFSDTTIIIKSDKRRVEQILLNLMSNAIKFSNNSIVTINVFIKNNMVHTEIIDQGIGIKKQDLDKLFKPFIQVERGLTRNNEGTGLGLAISISIVEKLGGTMAVKSKFGKGSTFSFTLPL